MRTIPMQGFSYFQLLILLGLFAVVSSILTKMLNKIIIDDMHNSQLQIAIINLANTNSGNMEADIIYRSNKLPGQQVRYHHNNVTLIWKTDSKIWLCQIPQINTHACIVNK